MQPDHLSRLKAAGVWPGGLEPEAWSDGQKSRYRRWHKLNPTHLDRREQDWGWLDDDEARALLIDRMMDELPAWWCLFRVNGGWHIADEDDGHVTQNNDKFLALFDALVASGRVK